MKPLVQLSEDNNLGYQRPVKTLKIGIASDEQMKARTKRPLEGKSRSNRVIPSLVAIGQTFAGLQTLKFSRLCIRIAAPPELPGTLDYDSVSLVIGSVMRKLLLIALLLFAPAALAQTVSDEMSAGVEAYKSAMYEKAISHFQKALQLQPSLTVAHLYLAHAYAQMYIPGAEAAPGNFDENKATGENAVREFKLVLAGTPTPQQRARALHGIASLLFNMKQLEQARRAYEELIKLDPEDPETVLLNSRN